MDYTIVTDLGYQAVYHAFADGSENFSIVKIATSQTDKTTIHHL